MEGTEAIAVEPPGDLEALATPRVEVLAAGEGISVSVADDGQPTARAVRAAADWLCDDLASSVMSGSIQGRVGIVVRRLADEREIVTFAVSVFDAIAGSAHPMRRFGEIAAMGPARERLGRPLVMPEAATPQPPVTSGPSPDEPVPPRLAESGPGRLAAPLRFEWIGPVITPAPASTVVERASNGATASAAPEVEAPAGVDAGSGLPPFRFEGLPEADASGLFDVWLLEPGPEPARTAEVILRVVPGSVAEFTLVTAANPAPIALGVSARECRRIEASLRYTTRAHLRATSAHSTVA